MKVLKKLNLEDVVFLDIETTRLVEELKVDTPLYESWEYKMKNSREAEDGELNESYVEKASLYPEFSKITCISCGKLRGENISLKSYTGEEKDLLTEFNNDLETISKNNPNTILCAHAGIGFDIPFIMKRCIVNEIDLHDLIDISGKKPWEVGVVDTNVIWKASSFSGASLINICVALGIPSPKTDMSGALAAKYYWNSDNKEEAVERIKNYCEEDVKAVIAIVLKCRGEKIEEPLGVADRLYQGREYTNVVKEELESLIENAGDMRKECFEILESTARKRNTKFKLSDVKELKLKYV